MADHDPSETIRQAAADSMRHGEDIRRRVHDVTLEALKNRRFDREGIREVVRAVSEGVTRGADAGSSGLRDRLAEAFRGMDEALTKSVAAGQQALRQMAATGRGFSDHELKQGVAGLKKIEHDFVETVNQVASSANERLRPELKEALRQTLHAGTETGRQSARLMAEFTLTGIELAGEFSARFAQVASGVLAGMADALSQKKDPGPR
ncbi:MAG: hypothetical protein K0S03_1388 [Burkholderiales bacterium]|jgi:hypothetical protein|nr:hypothetical protein [Burkholderiales bacterium]